MDELDQLKLGAAGVDSEAAPQAPIDPNAPPPAPPVDYGLEARMSVDTFSSLVCGYAPAAAAIWTDDAKNRVAMSLAPVLEKYGITLGALPPELLLAMTAGPLLYASAKIVATQMQTERTKAATTAEAPRDNSSIPDHGVM